jgi:hypothetical protein
LTNTAQELSGYALQQFQKRRQDYGNVLLEHTIEGETEPSQKYLKKFMNGEYQRV